MAKNHYISGSMRKTPTREPKTTPKGKQNRTLIRTFLKNSKLAIEKLSFSKLVTILHSRKVPTSKKEPVFSAILLKGDKYQLAKLYEREKDQSKKSRISGQINSVTVFEDGKEVFLVGKELKNESLIDKGLEAMFASSKKSFEECEESAGNLAKFKLYGDKEGWLEGKLRTCKEQFEYIRDSAGYNVSIFNESLEIIEKIDKLIKEFCIL